MSLKVWCLFLCITITSRWMPTANARESEAIRHFFASRNDHMTAIPSQFVLFGDSLTQYSFMPGGFGNAAADLYQRKLDVLNRGYSGYTTSMLKHVAPHVMRSDNPIQIMTLWTGSNDAKAQRPISDFQDDLRALINAFFITRPLQQATPHKPVLLVIPPLPRVDVPNFTTKTFSEAAERTTKQMAKIYPDQIAFVDLHDSFTEEAYRLFGTNLHEALSQIHYDGVHPNAYGYAVRHESSLTY